MASGRCPTRRPDAIHFFVNFDVFKSLYFSDDNDDDEDDDNNDDDDDNDDNNSCLNTF